MPIIKILFFNLIYYILLFTIIDGMPPFIGAILVLGGYFFGYMILDTNENRTWVVLTAGAIWLIGPGLILALDSYLFGNAIFYSIISN